MAKSDFRSEQGALKSWTGIIFLILLVFPSCEKKEPELDPLFGPAVERQFGDVRALVRELSFNSGGFKIFGDFRSPMEGESFPVILMIHGSGGASRHGAVNFEPLIEIYIRNGFAVFSWDKHGTGKSTGGFASGQTIFQRADIVLDAIHALQTNPVVDKTSIGLWGLSQAGWVMPRAMEKAGNPDYQVITFENAGHVLTEAETGCLDEAVGPDWIQDYPDMPENWIVSQQPSIYTKLYTKTTRS